MTNRQKTKLSLNGIDNWNWLGLNGGASARPPNLYSGGPAQPGDNE